MMTAASMPNGSEKNSVESSVASTKMPTGDVNVPITHWVSERMVISKRKATS
jgi:hypothetical protein